MPRDWTETETVETVLVGPILCGLFCAGKGYETKIRLPTAWVRIIFKQLFLQDKSRARCEITALIGQNLLQDDRKFGGGPFVPGNRQLQTFQVMVT